MKRISDDNRLLLIAQLRRAADLLESDPPPDEGYEALLVFNTYKGQDKTMVSCNYDAYGSSVIRKTMAIAKIITALVLLEDEGDVWAIESCVEHAIEGLENAKRIEAELDKQAKSRLN